MMSDTETAQSDVIFAAVQIQHAAIELQKARELVRQREHELAVVVEQHGSAVKRLVCVVAP